MCTVANELKEIIRCYQEKLVLRVPDVANGFQEDTFQSTMASINQQFMPGSLLNETKEYLKVIELINRYMRNGKGHIYLRRGANRDALTSSRAKSGGVSELPDQFSSHAHLDDFLKFFSSYCRKTNRVIELCLKVGAIDHSAFGSSSESTHMKFFRIRFKKTLQKCIQRCYKSIMVLFKLFPESRLMAPIPIPT